MSSKERSGFSTTQARKTSCSGGRIWGKAISYQFSVYANEYDFVVAFGLMDRFEGKAEKGEGPLGSSVTRKKAAGVHTILLKGAFIDETQTEVLTREVEAAVREQAKEILLDLKETDFVSSPVLSKFLAIHKICKEKGVEVRILNANHMVKDVFNLTDMGEFFGL